MDKKRGMLLIGLLILLVIPLVHAGTHGAGAYSAGTYGVGEVPATPPSGGGGIATTTVYECSEDSDCEPNQYCFEYKCYDAECFDDSVCNVEKGETCWHGRCVELFDVEIKDFESPVKLGEFFEFTYLIKGMANINDDVEVHFWIEKNEEVITSGHDTIYIRSFEEKTKTTKLFLPSNITSGDYVFSVQLIYGTYQANSHRTIEIQINEGLATIGFSSLITSYIISALIGIGAFILFLIFYLERRKVKKAIMPEVRWIKKYRITILTSLSFVILGALIYYFKWYELIADWGLSIASWSKINIMPYLSSYGYYILGGIVLLAALVILVIVARKKKLFEKFKKWNKRREREEKIERVKAQVIEERENIERVKAQVIEERENIESRENMKRFFEKYKILLSVILLLIILAGVIGYLFYAGILTIGWLKNLGDGIVSSLNKAGGWIKTAWNSVVGGLITGYNATVGWIIGNWLYLAVGVGVIILVVASIVLGRRR